MSDNPSDGNSRSTPPPSAAEAIARESRIADTVRSDIEAREQRFRGWCADRAARAADLRRIDSRRRRERQAMLRQLDRMARGRNAIAPTLAEQLARLNPADNDPEDRQLLELLSALRRKPHYLAVLQRLLAEGGAN